MAKNIMEFYIFTNSPKIIPINIDLERVNAIEHENTQCVTIYIGTNEIMCYLYHPANVNAPSAEKCFALYKRLIACWREGHQNILIES